MADRDELIAQLIEQAIMTPGVATIADYIAAVVDGRLISEADAMGWGPTGGRRIAIIEELTMGYQAHLGEVWETCRTADGDEYDGVHFRIVTPDPEEA